MNSIVNDFLLISANIGSTFDFPDRMFPSWIDNVTIKIQEQEPLFFAIHCQEVGGKNYEESMQYVDRFIKLLLKNPALNCYDKARIYLDEDFTVEEKFTALGSFYFIHETITNVEQWDFIANEFIPVESRELFSANIEHVPHKFKEKFPLEFFPEQKWSRKGYIHTRWKVLNMVMDFVNIHLFHDICNLAPIIKDSSTYSACRSRALEYTMKKVTKDYSENIPLFIFGDFNFRLATQKLIKQLVESKATIENVYKKSQSKSDEIRKIVYWKQESPIEKKISLSENIKNGLDKDQKILEVARKTFDMPEYNSWFVNKSEMFRNFDEEPLPFFQYLHEFPVSFPPSYPFSEEEVDPKSYMTTRCPSWCDRIMLNPDAKKLIQVSDENPVKYEMIGLDSCIGDHKPIYLSIHLNPQQESTNDQSTCNYNTNAESYSSQVVNSSDNSKKLVNGSNDGEDISVNNHVDYAKVPCQNNNSSSRRLFHSVITKDHYPHYQNRKRHSIVDSINGLRATPNADKHNEMWNIFDYGRFDKETELDIKFRLSHRPYVGMSSSTGELSATQSNTRNVQALFIHAARQITAAENVISAFRHSINRKRKISDSSSENDAGEGQNQNINCDDIIVETYKLTPSVNNNSKAIAQNVPMKSSDSEKKLNQKITCCTIS